MSWQALLIRKLLLPGIRESLDFSKHTVEELRGKKAAIPLPPGTRVERQPIGALNAEWVAAASVPTDSSKTILYFHGGGFVMGSCESHRGLAARISAASGVRVLLIDYRLAPEHPYPAANEDCMTVYRWLLSGGIDSREIVIGGDSAGGGLALMTLLTLREAGEALPAATFMLSPFAEYLRFDGESYQSNAERDPLVDAVGSRLSAKYYIGLFDSVRAILQPLDMDMAGLPPMLIQVGEREVLRSDSVRLAERAGAAGVEAVLENWPGMWHVFQLFAPILPEANRAIRRVGEFVREKLDV